MLLLMLSCGGTAASTGRSSRLADGYACPHHRGALPGDVERGTLHGLLKGQGLMTLADKVPLEAW